jgi:thioredoxin 1
MRYILLSIMMVVASFASLAKTPFSEQAFKQAQANNEIVLIDVYASWCPTCQKQSAVLADYFQQHPTSQIKVFVVDFDEQKEWVTYFKAPRQSTLILFKGQQQVWFTVAETNTNRIFKALTQAEAK